jgi:hypothetical protein
LVIYLRKISSRDRTRGGSVSSIRSRQLKGTLRHTASSLASPTTLPHAFIRSTACRRNSLLYRFLFFVPLYGSFPAKCASRNHLTLGVHSNYFRENVQSEPSARQKCAWAPAAPPSAYSVALAVRAFTPASLCPPASPPMGTARCESFYSMPSESLCLAVRRKRRSDCGKSPKLPACRPRSLSAALEGGSFGLAGGCAVSRKFAEELSEGWHRGF